MIVVCIWISIISVFWALNFISHLFAHALSFDKSSFNTLSISNKLTDEKLREVSSANNRVIPVKSSNEENNIIRIDLDPTDTTMINSIEMIVT